MVKAGEATHGYSLPRTILNTEYHTSAFLFLIQRRPY